MPFIPNNNGWEFASALVGLCLNNCPFKWPLLFGYARELIRFMGISSVSSMFPSLLECLQYFIEILYNHTYIQMFNYLSVSYYPI